MLWWTESYFAVNLRSIAFVMNLFHTLSITAVTYSLLNVFCSNGDIPARYPLCIFRTCMYIAISRAFAFDDSHFIRMYHAFDRISTLVFILYYFFSNYKAAFYYLQCILFLALYPHPDAIPENQRAENHRVALQLFWQTRPQLHCNQLPKRSLFPKIIDPWNLTYLRSR